MLQIKDVYKVYNNTILENINLEINESTIILGPSSDLLLQVAANLFTPDKGEVINNNYFYIFYTPNKNKNFNKVKHLIKEYRTYYDIDSCLVLLERYNFDLSDKLNELSFSRLKLLYFIIAISSNVEFIIAEYLFDNLELSVKSSMIDLINNSKSKLLFTSTEDVSGIVENIIFVDKTVKIVNYNNFINKYIKLSIVLDQELREEVIYKEIINNVLNVIIEKDNKEKFISNVKPVFHDEYSISLEDIGNII